MNLRLAAVLLAACVAGCADDGPRSARGGDGAAADLEAELERLRAIGYAEGTEEVGPEAGTGVTLHDVEGAFAGLNLVVSAHFPGAVLMDMEGRELHRWERPFRSIWPDHPTPPNDVNTRYWRRARLLPDGGLVALFEGLGVFAVDRDSELLWAAPNGAHHDLDVRPSGEVWVLTRRAHLVPRVDPERPILEDFVMVLDREGRPMRQVSLLECFERSSEHAHLWKESPVKSGDVFHTNTLQVLDGAIAEHVPAFESGRVLTSMLILDAIAVVDLDLRQVVWAARGDFKRQHDPQILPNGNLLLFDNEGRPGRSSVQEYDPATMELVWSYRGTPERPFYSRWCGAAQRLANGNTLISETSPGRALEVTPAGELVWEYRNPGRVGADGEFVAKLLEVVRLPADEVRYQD